MLIEFIKSNSHIIGYVITLIISLKAYGKYFDSVIKYLPIIITYTFLNELLGYYLLHNPNFYIFKDFKGLTTNHIIYNLFDLIFFPYFYYIFWSLISNIRYKKYIAIGSMVVVVGYLINAYFQNPMNYGLYYAYTLASYFLIFCIVLYFIDKKQTNKKIIQPYNLVFWLSLGLSILYIFSPIFFLIAYLDENSWHVYNLGTINHILIVLTYSLFCIGFVKCRKREIQ